MTFLTKILGSRIGLSLVAFHCILVAFHCISSCFNYCFGCYCGK